MQNNAFAFNANADLSTLSDIMKNLDRPAIEVVLDVVRMKLDSQLLKDRCYFLEGRTGSGKSTYLISTMFKEFNKRIIVVEPKVILAQSNPINVCRFVPDLIMGNNIGYSTGSQKIPPTAVANIHYMTTEIFKQKLLKKTKPADIVVLDEVHTLDMPMISTLNVVFETIRKTKDVTQIPLFIFTSATINIKMMIEYYKQCIGMEVAKVFVDPLMVGHIMGTQNFLVKRYFISQDLSNKMYGLRNRELFFEEFSKWLKSEIIPQSDKSESKLRNGISCRDILVFVPITSPIESIAKSLAKLITEPFFAAVKTATIAEFMRWKDLNRGKKRYVLVGYSTGYSDLSNEILKFSLDPDPDSQMNETKIFVSTPAIETGKTIATLYVCIDLGFRFTMLFNPLKYNPKQFYGVMLPIDKSGITQRLGRVGRESPGIGIHFYTEEAYNKLESDVLPDNINMVSLATTYIESMNQKDEGLIYDLASENNYIVKNSVDTLIRTGQDLIDSCYLSPISNIDRSVHNNVSIPSWLMYAKMFYYVDGMNIFEACFLARVNRKFLPNTITPTRIHLKYTAGIIDEFDTQDTATKNEITESIMEARMYFNQLRFDYKNSPFIKLGA